MKILQEFSPKLSVDPVDDMTVLVDWTHIKGQPLNVSIYNEAGKLFHLRKISNKIPKSYYQAFISNLEDIWLNLLRMKVPICSRPY